ncbi:hypothetical protein GTPT_0119 [Tatumella ptyseos ATCC 33301]|uniref:Uncharacterized protein n=1 Tax=Tatumella ptyseos ATCC 33301 TaxID=1005995 RepID=A0A085JQ00_9GAMM|nr:hypothetical protein GTPT_0119 [Tatumella ptyseos ATCC 33301]
MEDPIFPKNDPCLLIIKYHFIPGVKCVFHYGIDNINSP